MKCTIKAENLLKRISTQDSIPPLDQWNPSFCGDIPMYIDKYGRWYYQGTLITRPSMVNMFARILWKENEQYFLKTPIEKVAIEVEDVPFYVIEVKKGHDGPEQLLIFKTSTEDRVVASSDNPMRVVFDPISQQSIPYLTIRWGMEARLSRNVYYQLADWAYEEHDGSKIYWSVMSQGVKFVLDSAPID